MSVQPQAGPSAAQPRTRRTYDNRGRAGQAAQTRHRVLMAARTLLLERGYAATSMVAVARAAGVSRETVYKAFGSKQALIKSVYDVTVAGDDDAVPMTGRDAFTEMLADPDARSMLTTLARLHAELFDRLGPMISMIIAGGRSGDSDLAELAATSEAERMIGLRRVTDELVRRGQVRSGLDADRAADITWLLVAPEVWQLLVMGRGWSSEDYCAWLAHSLTEGLLGPGAGITESAGPAPKRLRPGA